MRCARNVLTRELSRNSQAELIGGKDRIFLGRERAGLFGKNR
jgi:hypothetical protein